MTNATAPGRRPAVSLDPARLPRHVAVIMDGNRRWARGSGLSVLQGHQRGARTTRMVIETCVDVGVSMLTLYAFSTENWNRPRREVRALMRLIESNLRHELPELHANRVRIQHIGRRSELPATLLRQLDEAIDLTRDNPGLVLNLAIDYGGRSEILEAARALARRAVSRQLRPEEIDESTFARELYTRGAPDPDLLIRTGGEMRISNFLPWQIAYAELYLTPTLWPNFSQAEFLRALAEFQTRERRFGSNQTWVDGENGHSR